MGEKVIIVDDEVSIITLLEFHLQKAGYQVYAATDGRAAIKLAEEEVPDLMILDLMLPGMDGLDVCRQLRQKKLHIPVIMLTAKDDEFDKVLGLELGADDYITKPFSPREVMARVKAVLRRSRLTEERETEPGDEQIQIGELAVYPEKYEAYLTGAELDLTPKEFELLLFLSRHRGMVLSREKLLNAVWHYDFMGDTRIVDVHISHLRDKIEDQPKKPQYIKTIRGMGYKLEEP
ncbi:MAG TPA: response regulator transcription factor [Bacillales bacterium]|nr:response regulator transcription factor [Bacillales bacterium]